ncbi:MAG: thiamine diphosphokinase [Clostridia bacterium]|nr:thiamine diphosphokinase [Clostridia bacterium]
MNRCVIIGGAPINDYDRIKKLLCEDDFYIACDSGLKHTKTLCISPDLIIGDFDSYEKPNTDTETITLPREKDDTDSFFAVKEALKRGFDDFLIIGVIGKRLDHSLGNISALLYLDSLGKKASIADDYSVMEIVSSTPAFVTDEYPYFSLLAVDGDASGITVKNAKFPLENAKITAGYQYGISNEAINGKTAEISIKEGRLLLVKVINE